MISYTEILNCIAQQNYKAFPKEAFEAFAQEHPYFSIGQIINHGVQESTIQKPIVGLHKGDAFLSSLLLHKVKNAEAKEYIEEIKILEKEISKENNDFIGEPLYTQDYFTHQKVSTTEKEVNEFVEEQIVKKEKIEKVESKPIDNEKPLTEDGHVLITRTFTDWLAYFRTQKEAEQKETKSKEALRAMWQKEKLTAAMGEENDLVPEEVFKVAIASIHENDDNVSESLAKIKALQGHKDKAIEMYQKLSLKFPEKNSYFASKINELINN
jgi:hypothetical protein